MRHLYKPILFLWTYSVNNPDNKKGMREGMILLSYCRRHKKIDMLGKQRRNISGRGAVVKKNWLSPQECYNINCSVGSYFFII